MGRHQGLWAVTSELTRVRLGPRTTADGTGSTFWTKSRAPSASPVRRREPRFDIGAPLPPIADATPRGVQVIRIL